MKAEQRISYFKEAKQIDLVEYISSLGFKPAKIRGNDYWYLSPLREEKTASFKIDRKINCWYDHGLGKGGNLVDFGVLYFNCSSTDFLKKLDGNFFLHQPLKAASKKLQRLNLRFLAILFSAHHTLSTTWLKEKYRIALQINIAGKSAIK